MKYFLKRGGLLAIANWPAVAIQFIAQTTFQALLAVPIVGAAVLVAVFLGADVGNLVQDSFRETFTAIADALVAEPIALVAFMAAFGIVLVGGSVLMFLVKGGTVATMLAADAGARPIEREALTLAAFREAAQFSLAGFVAGCERLFRRYLLLGIVLMLVYAATAAGLAFFVYGYRATGDNGLLFGWTLAALAAIATLLWITCVNFIYLLVQIVIAAEDTTLSGAARAVARFVRAEFLELGGLFLVIFGLVVAATVASALAWSAVALIAFVPLIGLAIGPPLQILALLLRGLAFEYIGLTAMGAYITLYRRHAAGAVTAGSVADPVARAVSAR